MSVKKIGIVCCSNGQQPEWKSQNEELITVLSAIGIETVFSNHIYAVNGSFSGTAQERAEALMAFYRDDSIDIICDISGGDIANEILPYLDYDAITAKSKQFWGYSDLTTILNAIYTKTGKTGTLYQIKNLVYQNGEMQQKAFSDTIIRGKDTLYQFPYTFLQGDHMEGVVVGGNIRCFLKLAGTPYFPKLKDKLLMLEAYGGEAEQMVTYFSQLQQVGAFEEISGIILGTFTKMEEKQADPVVYELLKSFISKELPVIKTPQIGHGKDSRAILIGAYRKFN